MSLAFLAALVLASIVSRRGADRAILAGLARGGSAWEPAMAIAVLTGGLASGIAAWLGARLAGALGPDIAIWLAVALGLAALARAWTRPRRRVLREPTRSLFAFALVLAMVQALDAVRLAALALAIATGEPLLVACGAFLGAPIGLAASREGEAR